MLEIVHKWSIIEFIILNLIYFRIFKQLSLIIYYTDVYTPILTDQRAFENIIRVWEFLQTTYQHISYVSKKNVI